MIKLIIIFHLTGIILGITSIAIKHSGYDKKYKLDARELRGVKGE